MRKFLRITSFLIIASLAVPAGVFALPKNVQSSAKTAAVSAIQLVKVVAALPAQTVVPQAQSASAVTACSVKIAANANLVQNAGAVNLNQPASCFSLAPAQLAAAASLAVAQLLLAATVVVVNHSSFFETPFFAPSPLGPGSALPALVFAALTVILFEERKSIQKAATRLLGNFIQSLTLHQLRVLRC